MIRASIWGFPLPPGLAPCDLNPALAKRVTRHDIGLSGDGPEVALNLIQNTGVGRLQGFVALEGPADLEGVLRAHPKVEDTHNSFRPRSSTHAKTGGSVSQRSVGCRGRQEGCKSERLSQYLVQDVVSAVQLKTRLWRGKGISDNNVVLPAGRGCTRYDWLKPCILHACAGFLVRVVAERGSAGPGADAWGAGGEPHHPAP